MFSVQSATTTPSKLNPADLVLKTERRKTAHPIFLIMLAPFHCRCGKAFLKVRM